MKPGLPKRLELPVVRLPDWGWHYDEALVLEKLANSLSRHGQLAAVVVRETPEGPEVVDGRRRVAAMRALGWTHVAALNVGALSRAEAMRMAMDLELRSAIDYAALAFAVRDLSDADEDAATLPRRLASTTPWDAERIGYFVQLADFDWSAFKDVPDEQHGFSWDSEPAAAVPEREVVAPPVPEPDVPQDVPRTQCPQCLAWQDDLDGFGVLHCLACGYCTHASTATDVFGNETCGLCKTVLVHAPAPEPEEAQPEPEKKRKRKRRAEIQVGLFGD